MKAPRFTHVFLFISALSQNTVFAMTATEMMADANLAGGLVVCVGADLELVTVLNAHDAFVVHVLSRDLKEVAAMRAFLRRKGWYGRVSVDRLEGDRLPHTDNLVNLFIDTGDEPGLTKDEILRVLSPKGVAFIHSKEVPSQTKGWTKIGKPWPKAMDEWAHYLHDPTGNPVAEDDLVKPPRQLQWVSDPQWARHHEHMASMNALVSSGGRLFFICDEGPKVSMLHPPQWKLTARDAFNGLLLWQRSIDVWLNHLHPLKRTTKRRPKPS